MIEGHGYGKSQWGEDQIEWVHRERSSLWREERQSGLGHAFECNYVSIVFKLMEFSIKESLFIHAPSTQQIAQVFPIIVTILHLLFHLLILLLILECHCGNVVERNSWTALNVLQVVKYLLFYLLQIFWTVLVLNRLHVKMNTAVRQIGLVKSISLWDRPLDFLS